jgi:hypothetical protein
MTLDEALSAAKQFIDAAPTAFVLNPRFVRTAINVRDGDVHGAQSPCDEGDF